ncbi:unnamed protein product [Coffea canephora]|uniref:Pex N-terminal domain-containing protein n=1 Tax=Coffea canephora TaxID=49390 RepID=A0A068U2W0_COFCA|nr:unnamed protein product [Coffea canephora]
MRQTSAYTSSLGFSFLYISLGFLGILVSENQRPSQQPWIRDLKCSVCLAFRRAGTYSRYIDTSSRISKIRSRKRERLHGPPWLKAVQGALLSSMYAYFFFKMMEGWYQSAEERMSAPTVYPPPPPSPPPKVAKEGIPLPPDRMLCPLRSQKCVNPSAVAVSGFVFCYSCIFK